MSYGAICKHCRHWTEDHDESGRCLFSHPKFNNGEPCDCPGYELLQGSDFLQREFEKIFDPKFLAERTGDREKPDLNSTDGVRFYTFSPKEYGFVINQRELQKRPGLYDAKINVTYEGGEMRVEVTQLMPPIVKFK